MSASSRERITGWAAVAAQFAAIGGIVLSPGDPSSVPSWVPAVGWVLVVAGALVMVVAFGNLGSALTPTPVPIEGAGLRTSGLYARVRHPIYTGLMMLAAGLVLRSPGVWPVFWFIVLVVILTAKAIWEEHMLADAYPTYACYLGRTGRFVPRLRRPRPGVTPPEQ